MKTSKFSESQIIKALQENEQGRSVGDLSSTLSTLKKRGELLKLLFLH